jgi:hypothetical protein
MCYSHGFETLSNTSRSTLLERLSPLPIDFPPFGIAMSFTWSKMVDFARVEAMKSWSRRGAGI